MLEEAIEMATEEAACESASGNGMDATCKIAAGVGIGAALCGLGYYINKRIHRTVKEEVQEQVNKEAKATNSKLDAVMNKVSELADSVKHVFHKEQPVAEAPATEEVPAKEAEVL